MVIGADSRMIDRLRLICALRDMGREGRCPSRESHECLFYIYIYVCIEINCCCSAYQEEEKFEAMSNKTRIIHVSVTAAPCLGWVSLYKVWDLHRLGCGGAVPRGAPWGGAHLYQQNPVCAELLPAAFGAGSRPFCPCRAPASSVALH